jgi:hypothetical protein
MNLNGKSAAEKIYNQLKFRQLYSYETNHN